MHDHTPHFNGLTPAEAELLAILHDEAAEVLQEIAKIQRHGIESCNPDAPGLSNRRRLERELGDFCWALGKCCAHGLINDKRVEAAVEHKQTRAEAHRGYFHHIPI